MLEAGIPLPAIKSFLGRSSIEAAMICAAAGDELKSKRLKESGMANAIPGNTLCESRKAACPGLDFLNKLT
ncbi:MAG: hypothetical protein LBU32_06330 [Clostridiales bacterium]|jgi:hypothetical protein|nr:hypothetical protein [Clostridiales bacterium]